MEKKGKKEKGEERKNKYCIYCKEPIPKNKNKIYCSTICCVRFHYKNRDRNIINDISSVRHILKRSQKRLQLIIDEIEQMKTLKKKNCVLMDKRLRMKKSVEKKIHYYQERIKQLREMDLIEGRKIRERLIKEHLKDGGKTK